MQPERAENSRSRTAKRQITPEQVQQAIDDYRDKERRDRASELAAARREGRAEGKLEVKLEIAKEMLKEGFSVSEIARLCELPQEKIEELTL